MTKRSISKRTAAHELVRITRDQLNHIAPSEMTEAESQWLRQLVYRTSMFRQSYALLCNMNYCEQTVAGQNGNVHSRIGFRTTKSVWKHGGQSAGSGCMGSELAAAYLAALSKQPEETAS